jgi:exopolyphosphatase/guanosine-5'-triphosphate,3'-diphosphate pyrophosphatase
MALLHRYKNSRANSPFAHLFELISEADQAEAEVLGKAMRFGAMFALHSPQDAAEIDYSAKKGLLTLSLTPKGEGLFGEVAEARFASLAAALGAKPRVKRP